MYWAIRYSIEPSLERSRSVFLLGGRGQDSSAELFVYSGRPGTGYDYPHPRLWKDWKDGTKPQAQHISREAAELVFQQVQKVSITPAAEGEGGLDGVSYRLEVFSGSNKLSFNWWETLPPQWSALRDVIQSLEAMYAEAGTPLP